MIKKGVISNISGMSAEAYLPEEDNAVTPMLPLIVPYGEVKVGDKCVVMLYDTENINFANGIILTIPTTEDTDEYGIEIIRGF